MHAHAAALKNRVVSLAPGVLLCVAVTASAFALEAAERAIVGRTWFEALVLAILIGAAVRTAWLPDEAWHAGIAFSAKYILELAVVLLGASVSAATIISAGGALILGIVAVVATAILISVSVGKLLGLTTRMALLVACGNSICGNSAIAAVAPVIGADSDDVAASIAFTAVLGVVVVLFLPLVGRAIGMTATAYGALAGLTVYAVPQVLAAASPLGAKAVQIGTLVKLIRVLMLGPVCVVLSVVAPHIAAQIEPQAAIIAGEPATRRLSLAHLVPWFILGFVALVVLRSSGFVPTGLLAPIRQATTSLTVISMAALGLGVDIRSVANAGGKVTIAVILSLIGLAVVSLLMLHALGWS